ncbi:uncharacterized protein TNCV_1357071 [Trichonephila clavipes]|uniref:Uncharacterized protein n=1 Tax=Trichonephila clavipes TaxID=2585209 RepID=A0A8X6SH26_TRICX|nr:uncharacterized protein TNCV_1357071 [Trichonephila clavipes]
MATLGFSFTPTPLGYDDYLGVRYHPRVNTSQWRPFRFNFPHPEVGGAAGLGGHVLGRARDWYDIFGSALVQNTATDFAQLKVDLTKNLFVVRNGKDLERIISWRKQSSLHHSKIYLYFSPLIPPFRVTIGTAENHDTAHIMTDLPPCLTVERRSSHTLVQVFSKLAPVLL